MCIRDSSQGGLKAGETILPHLYLYDAETDAVIYKYGDPVLITSEGEEAVKASVEIVTSQVRADSCLLYTSGQPDGLTGNLCFVCGCIQGQVMEGETGKGLSLIHI